MIEYSRGPYGANLLFRWHGSALAKAFIPGLLSVGIYYALQYAGGAAAYAAPQGGGESEYLNHPYAIGVLVSSVSFLIIFRANYGYQRYWEACTMVHKLMSKWMDASVFASVFHLQSEHYRAMRPPSFFDHDDLNRRGLTRDRERRQVHHFLHQGSTLDDSTGAVRRAATTSRGPSEGGGGESCEPRDAGFEIELGEVPTFDDEPIPPGSSAYPPPPRLAGAPSPPGPHALRADLARSSRSLRRRRYVKSINRTEDTREYVRTQSDAASERCDETHLLGPPRLDGGWGLLYRPEGEGGKAKAGTGSSRGVPTATYCDVPSYVNGRKSPLRSHGAPDPRGFASTRGGRTPSLFLQELAHLSSLLCAVALTTLRNDLDDVESPLDVYVPGQPWPVADPVQMPKEIKRRAYEHRRLSRNLRYLLGMDQTRRARTIYNAARPMLVVGGVSDNEIAFLQRARRPYAKTQLVWGWLSDFIIREHLAGSMGNVGPPIVSRVVQFLSDGILYYNHARKIMYTPFPFPHAQLSAFFVLMMVVAIPLLMDQYANEAWLGAALSFLTVTCLAGLHEVARELENPFRNAPNDVPLCTLLAFYNEALVTMFAGHHPDAYWDGAEAVRGKRGGKGGYKDGDGGDLGMPELSEESAKAGATAAAGAGGAGGKHPEGTAGPTPTPTGAPPVPQSATEDGEAGALKELREMIESQAAKIRELQERVARNEGGGPPAAAQRARTGP
ncbi:hypothetical protein ACHAWF_004786 [Thalassiosira exigua]